MTKYRIVRHKYSKTAHYVQEKVFGLFWLTIGGSTGTWDLLTCEGWIEGQVLRQQLEKECPRAEIVKEIEV